MASRIFPLVAALAAASPLLAAEAIVSSEFINPHSSYPSCHASTITETADHVLVAAWFGGTAERNPDVGIWVCRQIGGIWQQEYEAANGIQKTGPRQPTWNPVLVQIPKGPLLLFYKVGPSPSEWWGEMKSSSDGGQTWSAATRLPPPALGPIKDKPWIEPDGELLCGSSTEGGPQGWRVHFEHAGQAGATWSLSSEVEPNGFHAIQPTILKVKDGFEALCRTEEGVIVRTRSSDGGLSWSPLESTGLPNPNSGIDAVTLSDGRQLLVYNRSGGPGVRKAPRFPLNVALSADGTAWKDVLVLEDKPLANGYAYPAVFQTSDGLVHITYTWGRRHIKHVVLNPNSL